MENSNETFSALRFILLEKELESFQKRVDDFSLNLEDLLEFSPIVQKVSNTIRFFIEEFTPGITDLLIQKAIYAYFDERLMGAASYSFHKAHSLINKVFNILIICKNIIFKEGKLLPTLDTSTPEEVFVKWENIAAELCEISDMLEKYENFFYRLFIPIQHHKILLNDKNLSERDNYLEQTRKISDLVAENYFGYISTDKKIGDDEKIREQFIKILEKIKQAFQKMDSEALSDKIEAASLEEKEITIRNSIEEWQSYIPLCETFIAELRQIQDFYQQTEVVFESLLKKIQAFKNAQLSAPTHDPNKVVDSKAADPNLYLINELSSSTSNTEPVSSNLHSSSSSSISDPKNNCYDFFYEALTYLLKNYVNNYNIANKQIINLTGQLKDNKEILQELQGLLQMVCAITSPKNTTNENKSPAQTSPSSKKRKIEALEEQKTQKNSTQKDSKQSPLKRSPPMFFRSSKSSSHYSPGPGNSPKPRYEKDGNTPPNRDAVRAKLFLSK